MAPNSIRNACSEGKVEGGGVAEGSDGIEAKWDVVPCG